MTTPLHALSEISGPSMAGKEELVNEDVRNLEQGANWFLFKSRTTAAEPGAPTDGDCYIVPTGATGTNWAGQDDKIAKFINTGWVFLTAKEGMAGWVADEDVDIRRSASAWVTPVPVALADGATITPDLANGRNFTVTLGGNRTLANMSNKKPGMSGLIVVSQDATGSRTLSFDTDYIFPGGSNVISTGSSAIDVISYFVLSSGTVLCTLSLAYA